MDRGGFDEVIMVGVVKRIEDGAGRHDRVGQDVEDEHAAEEQQDLKGTCPPLIDFRCLSENFCQLTKFEQPRDGL